MARPLIVATNPMDPLGYEILAPHAEVVTAPDASVDTLRELVSKADAMIVRAQLPPDIFESAPRLLSCARHGAGLDLIPVDAATAKGIVVTNVPGVNANAVAEYAITQMLLSARPLHRVDRLHRDRDWGTARALSDASTELGGRTLGIVGVGAIGTRLAEIAHHGFRMKVIGHQRRLDALPAFVAPASLEDVFSQSDFIVLACPLTPETRGLASRERIARMKPGAMLVNVSRGPVVDEAALTDALAAGRIRGAGLDVYEKQPLPRDSKLLSLDSTVLTTHLAGMTQDSVREMSRISCEDTLRVLRGEKPLHFCNPSTWDAHLARRRGITAP
jgi:D-3-phosphoglycerate dehydrogenase